MEELRGKGWPDREIAGFWHRPRVMAFAVALAFGLSGCGGGGGDVKSSPPPPPPPPADGSNFTGGDVNVGSGDTIVWTYDIHGSIDLIKDGTGTLVLTGTDTYTGGTTINQGTLQLGNGGTTGSITGDVTDNGTLVFDRSDYVTFNGIVSGSGSLTKAGTGTLILTGANTYTGGTTISSGTLQLGNIGTTGWIIGNVTDNGTLAFNRRDNVIFNGTISGNGSLTQAGGGTVTLTGANTYTGGTTIDYGTLQLGNGGTTGWVTGDVTNNGTLVFNRSDNVTFNGAVSGGGSLTQASTGTLTLTGVNTYTGATLVSGGTLKIAAGGTLGMTGISVGGANQDAALEIDKGARVSGMVYLQAGGTLDNAGTLVTKLVGRSAVQESDFDEPVTIVNHDGGLIEGDSSQTNVYVPAINLGPNGDVVNGAGSTIRGYAGVATGGTVNNTGGSIIGITNDGIDGATLVNNSDGGTISAGTAGGTGPNISIGVKTGITNAIVNNVGHSTISGIYGGVWLEDGGTVTNDNNSTISGTKGISIGSMSNATGTVNNTGGSTISGTQLGIYLSFGGTVNNGPGSIIQTTATTSGDCAVIFACSIFVPVYDGFGSYGSNGSLSLTNAGIIIGNVQTGPAAVNSITLIAGGYIQGDLNIGSNAQSTLTLDGTAGTTQSYSNAVTGATTFAGTLVKNGDGTWIIDNSDLQAVIDTSINAGSLQATQILSGDVGVYATGNLDGVPGVAGNLSNAARVAVHGGDSTVGGNYAQSSTGTLAISLGSKLDVTGTATLNGGTLEVTGADSGYVSNAHTNVLTAGGGLTGTFAQLVKDTGVVFTATTINYDANSVWLDTTGLNVTTAAAGHGVSYTPASFGSAQRVQGAFNQLDNRIATGNLSGVPSDFLYAAGQFQQAPTLRAAQASLQSLSGELHAASAAMTFEAIDASSRALSDRFDNLLDKGTGFGMWTHSLSIGGDMARGGFNGVDFQLDGWLVGNDRQIGRSGVAGYAFGQSQGRQRLDQSFDHDNSRSTEGMMYAGWLNGNWYTQGRIGFGHFQQVVSRQILLGYSVQGVGTQYSGNYNVAYGESGLHFDRGDSHVTPFVNVEYARIGRDGFVEQGAGGFGLRSDTQSLDRWQAGLGVRAARHWNLDGGRAVDFSARVQWQRTLADHGDVFDASFVGLQQSQPLLGIGLSRYSGVVGLGLDATLSARTTLKFNYDYEMGQRDTAQMLLARLDVAF